jgi:large subunit ribosomal protein L6
MSKIGKLPISLPSGVTATIENGSIVVKGPKGELTQALVPEVTVSQEADILTVGRINNEKQTGALHGLIRSLIANMVIGVTEGFTKTLEIIGVGYRAEMQGTDIVLHIGYSHPVKLAIPKELEVKLEKNLVIISGIDKQSVGQFAAIIRSHRKPEPYKGKGIKYSDEVIKRKAGKAAKAGAK